MVVGYSSGEGAMTKPKKPKNGRLILARELVDKMVALGIQEIELARQLQEVFPDRRGISVVVADLIHAQSEAHQKLRRIIEDLPTIY